MRPSGPGVGVRKGVGWTGGAAAELRTPSRTTESTVISRKADLPIHSRMRAIQVVNLSAIIAEGVGGEKRFPALVQGPSQSRYDGLLIGIDLLVEGKLASLTRFPAALFLCSPPPRLPRRFSRLPADRYRFGYASPACDLHRPTNRHRTPDDHFYFHTLPHSHLLAHPRSLRRADHRRPPRPV